MDKIIPFNKGIHRQPSLGEAGELSECVNLIPQNGELVNVRGLEEMSQKTIKGELICVHKTEDKPKYFTLEGNTVHVYDTSLSLMQSMDVPFKQRGKVSSLAIGNIVVLSGFGEEYIFMMFQGSEYKLFTLSSLRVTSRLIPLVLEDYVDEYKAKGVEGINVMWPTSWEVKDRNNGIIVKNEESTHVYEYANFTTYQQVKGGTWGDVQSKLQAINTSCFSGVAFGIIGLKMYEGGYLYLSDIFSIDSSRLVGIGIENLFYSVGCHILAIEHNIPECLVDIVQSIDIFVTPPTALNDTLKEKDFKDSKEATKEMLGLGFYKVRSIPLSENGEWEFKAGEKRGYFLSNPVSSNAVADTTNLLNFVEGDAKTIVGELFGYNSRVHVFAGREYMPVHIGKHTNDLLRLDFTSKMYYIKADGSNNETYEEFAACTGPYGYALDSYAKNGDSYEYVEQLVDGTINVTIEDDDGKDKVLSWSGKIQYPLSPVFSVPTIRAKKMEIYVDLSSVYLISELNGSLPSYNRKEYGIFRHDLYKSLRYGLSAFINIVDRYDYIGSPAYGASYWTSNREGGICYSQPYQVEMHWHGLDIKYYGYKKDEFGNVVEGAKGWYMVDKNSYKAYAGKVNSEMYFRTNQIRYGEPANPFLMKSLNTVEAGKEVILSLSTTAKAISQGQFGQFPIYAFCTDGIWALEINEEGKLWANQPASRDVCNNAESVTQIDGAVVFTTDQGLKLIQGESSVLLSGIMEGHNVDERLFFKDGFFESFGLVEFDGLVVQETRDFRDILKTCMISYDYVNRMLRIFPDRDATITDIPYRYYAYSFDTQEFVSVIGNEFSYVDNNGVNRYNNAKAVVMDYPSSIVQIGNKLYRPMETEREGVQNGLLLTRPLMFDEPFALKKLHDLRLQYSNFTGESKCKVVVYVSNDGVHWMIARSLRGGAYKYFRIAVITKLTDADALTGAIMRYELERTNKLR